MTSITTKISDNLFDQVRSIAEREDITIDQFIEIALESHISNLEDSKKFEQRAKRGNWKRAIEILNKASDVEPTVEDRLN